MKKKYLFITCFLMLVGCQIKPLLSTSNQSSNFYEENYTLKTKKLNVKGSNSALVFKLRKKLQSKLEFFYKNPISLEVNVSEDFGNISYFSDATSSRIHGKIICDFEFKDYKTGNSIKEKVFSSTSFFHSYDDEFSNQNAIDLARERMIDDVIDEILRSCISSSQFRQEL
jgi:hypothetical protein